MITKHHLTVKQKLESHEAFSARKEAGERGRKEKGEEGGGCDSTLAVM